MAQRFLTRSRLHMDVYNVSPLSVLMMKNKYERVEGQLVLNVSTLNVYSINTIKTKSGEYPNVIIVYSDGALVYSDWSTRTVYKVGNCQTGWIPKQLSVTFFADLLVTIL